MLNLYPKRKAYLINIIVITMFSFLLYGCGKDNKDMITDTPTEQHTSDDNVDEEIQARLIPIDENAIQVSIDIGTTHQTIDGFGASFAWYSDWMTKNVHAEEAYDLLFDEAGFTILRFKNTYQYKNTFNINAELAIYEAAKARAAEQGEEIQVLLSSWSPAAYLKENNKIEGGSSLKKREDGTYMYEELGLYFKEAVQAYRDAGIPIDFLSIQNEPDYVADYDGCEFGITETETLASYSKAFLAVYDAISELPYPPKMLGPDTMTVSDVQISAYLREVLKTKPESLYGIAHHLYSGGTHERPDSFIMSMMGIYNQFPNIRRWQTEFYRGNALQTAWIIHNSMLYENLNAYLYWDGTWASPGGLVGFQYSHTSDYTIKDNYYAMKHFSRHIRPGYKRVDTKVTNRNLKVTAYSSENQDKVVVVAINTGDEDAYMQLHFNDFDIIEEKSFLSICQEDFTLEDLYQPGTPLSETQTFTLPANGIITFDITGKSYTSGSNTKGKQELTNDLIEKYVVEHRNSSNKNVEDIMNVVNGDNGASANFIANWDESNLYIEVNVSDKTPDNSDTIQNKDGVMIFINEDGTRPERYSSSDYYIHITRDNKITSSLNKLPSGLTYEVINGSDNYTIKAVIPIGTRKLSAGDNIGFDVRINDSHGRGILNYILQWADTSATTENNLSAIGILELK